MSYSEKRERCVYFDLDGTLLNYDRTGSRPEIEDRPKPFLVHKLEQTLIDLKVNRVVFVSGWTDTLKVAAPNRPYGELKRRFFEKHLDEFFSWAYCEKHVELVFDTDNRCQHINLKSDFAYVDDWAFEFFVKAHGETALEDYKQFIHLATPEDDGNEIIDFLAGVGKLWTEREG